MPRRARLVLPGFAHHVVQRGSRRRSVFWCEDDYATYARLLRKRCDQVGVTVVSHCLMPNHVHVIAVPTDRSGLSRCFGRAHADYARHINRREQWSGHLWQDRFSSFIMDETYFLACVRYVLSNPVRAGMVERMTDWPHSSARAMLHGEPDELVDRSTLSRYRLDAAATRRECEAEEIEAFRASTLSGRPVGSPDFMEAVERALGCSLAVAKRGRPRRVRV